MNSKDREVLHQIQSAGIKIHDSTKRNLQCFCHVNEEKSPSFFINLDTEMFNCFSCGLKGRGINHLIYEITGQKINVVTLPNFIKPKDKKLITPRIPILPLAIDNPGQEYLNKRGYVNDTIKAWKLQYWKDENGVIIPIENIGYIMRWIVPPDPKMKYKYIPGTRIETTLFGLTKFKTEDNSAILVEGSLDVIWNHQQGFMNTLGILHSDISEIQIKLLKGIVSKVYLMLDSDQPGIEATSKIRSKLRDYFIVKICKLPDGKDPNEVDRETTLKVIKEATYII